MSALSNVIGFDDAPFDGQARTEPVRIVGAVFARHRFDGLLLTQATRDGDDATDALVDLIAGSRFQEHLQGILLDGIAFGGFNVVDLHDLHARTGLPVLVVTRRQPDLGAIHRALHDRVPGGQAKWARIERAGPMVPLADVWAQHVGLSEADAAATIALHAVHGRLPEPLRVAHLIGAALATGHSHGGA